MEDRIFIQHRFQIIEGDLRFDDALVMLRDEYDKLSEDDIKKHKEERFTAWKEVLANPPVVAEIPDEQKLADVLEEINRLTVYKAELEAKIG